MIVLDTETDGFGPQAQVLELATVGVLPDGELFHEHFTSYVQPVTRHPNADGAFKVNGLSYTDVRLTQAPERAVVWHAFCEWAHRFVKAGGQPRVGAWNVRFDRAVMEQTFNGAPGVTWAPCLMLQYQAAYNKSKGPGKSLKAACAHFGIDYAEEEAHAALYDAIRAAKVYQKMRS